MTRHATERPDYRDNGSYQFAKGYTGGGAGACVHLSPGDVASRCHAKLGPGQLADDGTGLWWETPDPPFLARETTVDENLRPSGEKPVLKCVARHDPAGDGLGKYLVMRRDGTVFPHPSFVLGGRDPHADAALLAYADSIEGDPDCGPGLPASVRRLADEFRAYRAYRAEAGPGDPTRGLHRKDDPLVLLLMRQGRSA